MKSKIWLLIITSIIVIVTCAFIIANNVAHIPILNTINFIFHEAGHFIFYLLGTNTMFLMGSVTEVMIPLGIAIYFLYKRNFLSSVVILPWFATAIASVAIYISDSPFQKLHLWGGGEHDWAYLMNYYGLMNHVNEVVLLVKTTGIMVSVFIIIMANVGQYKLNKQIANQKIIRHGGATRNYE